MVRHPNFFLSLSSLLHIPHHHSQWIDRSTEIISPCSDCVYQDINKHIYEEDIKDLEYEKAFGYLTDHGKEFLEDYKKKLEELKEYKQYKEVLLRTATR